MLGVLFFKSAGIHMKGQNQDIIRRIVYLVQVFCIGNNQISRSKLIIHVINPVMGHAPQNHKNFHLFVTMPAFLPYIENRNFKGQIADIRNTFK